MPEPRYFSIPSAVVGGVVLRKSALNCSPCVRSVIQTPTAWMNSPAEIDAAWPTTGTRSRCPRAFTFRTAKPLSSLWKVTRSTEPTSVSLCGVSGALAKPAKPSMCAALAKDGKALPVRARQGRSCLNL